MNAVHTLPPVDLYLIFEKSSSSNWISNLQKSISKLIFAGYTGSKNPVRNRLKIQFVQLDFSRLIFHSVQVVFGVEKLAEKYHLAPSSSVLGTIVGL